MIFPTTLTWIPTISTMVISVNLFFCRKSRKMEKDDHHWLYKCLLIQHCEFLGASKFLQTFTAVFMNFSWCVLAFVLSAIKSISYGLLIKLQISI